MNVVKPIQAQHLSPLPTDGIRTPVASLVRACAAKAIATLDGAPAEKIVKREWSRGGLAEELVLRSSSVPDSLTGSASSLVRTVMPSFVATLATDSAAARIFKEGLQLKFDGAGKISVPTIKADGT